MPSAASPVSSKDSYSVQSAISPSGASGIVNPDDLQTDLGHGDSLARKIGKLPVGQKYLRFTVPQNERQRGRVQTNVERANNRSRHRNSEMRFEHRRSIRR